MTQSLRTARQLMRGCRAYSSLSSFDLFTSGPRPRLFVQRYTADGIITSTNVALKGPAILLNGQAYLWDVRPAATAGSLFDGWTADCFKIFEAVQPRPEILVFGTGKDLVPLPPQLRQAITSCGIQLEIQSTQNACSTFNVLAEEGRMVAAALLPMRPTDARTGKPLTKAD
ncbi:hypothetical protein RI367_002045 [Sorochytrium milnesiophthora]